MKKLIIAILAIAGTLSLTQCTTANTDNITSNADTRGKVISQLMNNDAYMNEVMDSMKTKHPHTMDMSGDNMMDKMMDMCKADSAMCKKMMGKTMEMCNNDTAKCKMMMNSMHPHPNVMKSMKGMCDMKGTKM